VTYSADTWYLVRIEFDVTTDTYDFAVYDASLQQLVDVRGIGFGNTIASGIDRITAFTSASFSGSAHLDDVMVRSVAASEPVVVLGPESSQTFTDAWARTTKTLNATPGATIRWSYSANDTSDNWTTSDIYSFQTLPIDTPPEVTLNSPADGYSTTTNDVEFRAICSDEYDVAQVSLYGDWSGSWSLVDTVTGPGINGVEVVFSETVPEGSWTWSVECVDDNANTTWGVTRTLDIAEEADPWWRCGWDYRQNLTVTENSGAALTSYPVSAVVDTASLIAAGKMRPDCADIRVADAGTEIPSQVVGCDSATTRVWLQTDLAAFETRQGLYLYYGNPVAVAPDYSGQNSITWDGGTRTMDTGKITGIFDVDGGAIAQIRDNTNNQDLLSGHPQGGVGYLFTDNAAVDYIFRIAESDDSIVLTTDGPIVKVVTSYSGESPQWIQESTFYNDQDFIDFTVYRPAGASTENFLVGVDEIAPDGVFDLTDADELLRAGDSATDTGVVFDEVWRYDPTSTRGYAGVVDPTFTNEIALVWDESVTPDFTWVPRTGAVGGIEGTYALFIGGDGTVNSFGTIDADTFAYRFVARYASSPSNADTQGIHDYYVAAPPAAVLGPEETTAVDTVVPQITINSPTNTTYDTDTILLAFTASEEVETCSYSLDGGASVPVPNCASTVLTFLGNGPHTVAVDAMDCAGNPGSDSVNFIVDVVPFPWWDLSWVYRVPVTVFTGDHARTNEPIEHVLNFTAEWGLLGSTGLTFDPDSVRVIEYTPSGSLIGEVASQFDPAAAYDPDSNAEGTVVWIMNGVTSAQTSRHYYVYFDATASPKTPPGYVTDLNWDTGTTILSNTGIEATIGTVLDGRTYKTGINSFTYGGMSYTTAAVAEGAGIYHIVRDVADEGDDVYEVLIDGPVKKTVRITPATHGSVDFTLYDLVEWIRAEGTVTGTKGLFTSFPYAHALSNTALSNELHYFDSGVVVDETVGTSGFGFLGGLPDEGWACYDGLGGNKDFCLVTDAVTLAASNNFWRYSSSSQQLIFPCWSPNPTFPITPTSWIVMGDTFQDGRDFWDRLSAPVVLTPGAPEYNCVATASDDLTCDGVDDDCDGSVDEDYVSTPTSCGVGECSGNAGQLECQGGIPVDTCDPLFGATLEICDTLDNDCDGLTDDADPDVSGQTTWYADADGDTFGDPAAPQPACIQPAGHVADSTDCNDADENNWASCATCADVDSDVWYAGCDAYVTIAGPDCDDADQNNWTSCATCADVDTDTWYVDCDAYNTINGPDCNDADGANFPGNTEICDGQDNDCDLLDDDADPDITGQTTWYADADGDTYGDSTVSLLSCAQPAGFVADGTDCNDADQNNWASCATCGDLDSDTWYSDCDAYVTFDGPDCADDDPNNWLSCTTCADVDTDTWYVDCDAYNTINGPDCNDADGANFPGNAEICDGQDNDCDLLDDDADPDVTGQATWHADVDGDTYGDSMVSLLSCAQPAGHVADSTDCNDADENNWASCATCDDVDADTWYVGCDAYVTIAGPDCDDTDENNWVSCTTCADVDTDTWYAGCDTYVTINGPDCFDDDSANFPGNAEICDGQDNDCDLIVDDADPDVTGQTTWYADVDGDTFGDAALSQLSCVQPAGYVADSTDCSDSDPNNWTSCGTCADVDTDTWFAGCDAYVTINGPDCFDDLRRPGQRLRPRRRRCRSRCDGSGDVVRGRRW
jgi:hypothetical protein